MRYAVKVAYDGRKFHGSQIQPGLRTVEGDFLTVAEELGVITDRRSFSRASRTDKGVSALGNVFVFHSEFEGGDVVRSMNSRLKDIWVRGLVEVPEEFNPRWAKSREYRYSLLYDSGFDLQKVIDLAPLFTGEHDFSSYTRDHEKNSVISLERVDVVPAKIILDPCVEAGARCDIIRFLRIDVVADHFLWNMVRRIVGALESVGYGEIGEEEVVASLKGAPLPPSVPTARPDFLVLMDVAYDPPLAFSFQEEWHHRDSVLGGLLPFMWA